MHTVSQAASASSQLAQAIAMMDARAVVRVTMGSALNGLDTVKLWDNQDEFYRGTPYDNTPAHVASGIKVVMQFIQSCQDAAVLLELAMDGKTKTHKQIASVCATLAGLGIKTADLSASLDDVQHQSSMLQHAYELLAILQRQGHEALDALTMRLTAGYSGIPGGSPRRLH